MAIFVLEIGTEEIPARFLKNEKDDLEQGFKKSLERESLPYDSLNVFVTPRRAVVIIKGLQDYQTEKEIIVQGPAKKISFSESGHATKALEGFLSSNGAELSDIEIVASNKGEYVVLRKKIGGKPASEILAEICPQIIQNLVFPKSMHWGHHTLHYARPIRWILALLDNNIVPFSIGHISSDRLTYGHRVHGLGPFAIEAANTYENVIAEKGHIVLDAENRRDIIIEKANENARKLGGKVKWNDDLLDEVTGLVELPIPLCGEFNKKFLDLPKEVLLTSMQSHQKSFGVEKENGELLPFFITVLNMKPTNELDVKTGWEKVLRARLEDAMFFWQEDLKNGFDVWQKKLDNVIFIGSLGTVGEKSSRLKKLVSSLADTLHLDTEIKNDLEKAANLCKADLVSGMVGEFDSLQGIMGGIYAKKLGYNDVVAQALSEQYLPTGPDSPLPESMCGCVLSIADKIDTLAGCFGLNMLPTGGADPNGLRRNALGIIRIILANELNISLAELIGNAYKFYGQQKWKLDEKESTHKLMDFFKGRMRHHFQQAGYDTILIDAVLHTHIDNINDCAKRLESLAQLKNSPNWLPIMQAMKRIQNIVDKSPGNLPNHIDESLLVDPAENDFYQILKKKLPLIDEKLKQQDYEEVLVGISELIPVLNTMFENVMINAEDEKLRLNRLALLNMLSKRFSRIANISLLQI